MLFESCNRNEQLAVAKPIYSAGEDDESLCACVFFGEEREKEEKELGKRKGTLVMRQ